MMLWIIHYWEVTYKLCKHCTCCVRLVIPTIMIGTSCWENIYMPLIYSIDVSCCWHLLKCSKTLNAIFNEVVTNYVIWIFMKTITQKIGGVGLYFVTWVDMFPLNDIFPYQLCLMSIIIYHNFCYLKTTYNCDSIFLYSWQSTTLKFTIWSCNFQVFCWTEN